MLTRRKRRNLTSYWSSCSFVYIFTPADVAMEQRSIEYIINELRLVLSEKRTTLSVLRTGIPKVKEAREGKQGDTERIEV
jgi:hypothetical protein